MSKNSLAFQNPGFLKRLGFSGKWVFTFLVKSRLLFLNDLLFLEIFVWIFA